MNFDGTGETDGIEFEKHAMPARQTTQFEAFIYKRGIIASENPNIVKIVVCFKKHRLILFFVSLLHALHAFGKLIKRFLFFLKGKPCGKTFKNRAHLIDVNHFLPGQLFDKGPPPGNDCYKA